VEKTPSHCHLVYHQSRTDWSGNEARIVRLQTETKHISPMTEDFLNLSEVFLTLTEGFPCFFLSCKANARVKLTKTGHGPHSSTLVVICVVRLLFVLFCVLFVCKCVLPQGDNPTVVNKYIISYFVCRKAVLTNEIFCILHQGLLN
jgi:hypothetical protein